MRCNINLFFTCPVHLFWRLRHLPFCVLLPLPVSVACATHQLLCVVDDLNCHYADLYSIPASFSCLSHVRVIADFLVSFVAFSRMCCVIKNIINYKLTRLFYLIYIVIIVCCNLYTKRKTKQKVRTKQQS